LRVERLLREGLLVMDIEIELAFNRVRAKIVLAALN